MQKKKKSYLSKIIENDYGKNKETKSKTKTKTIGTFNSIFLITKCVLIYLFIMRTI